MKTEIEKVFMRQVHGTHIETLHKDIHLNKPLHILKDTDGLITERNDVALIAYGADCLMLALWDNKKIGICHAGWRGFSENMIEKMLEHFAPHPHAFVGPFHHMFEIQKDECYQKIMAKCGDQFFEERNNSLFFNFKQAVESSLKKRTLLTGIFDSTFENKQFASWRRDKKKGNGTQNRLAIWRNVHGEVFTQLFLPGEKVVIESI